MPAARKPPPPKATSKPAPAKKPVAKKKAAPAPKPPPKVDKLAPRKRPVRPSRAKVPIEPHHDTRATAAELEVRIELVAGALLRGSSRADILQLAQMRGWGIEVRMTDDLIAKAKKYIIDLGNVDVTYERAQFLERNKRLLRVADSLISPTPGKAPPTRKEIMDGINVMRAIDRDRAKVTGIEAPSVIAGDPDNPIFVPAKGLTEEQLSAAIVNAAEALKFGKKFPKLPPYDAGAIGDLEAEEENGSG